MIAISRHYRFRADKAVQIGQAVFFNMGKQSKYTEHQNRLINQDIRSSLCLTLLGPDFLKISILFYILCAHNRKLWLDVFIFEIAVKVKVNILINHNHW